MGGGLCGSFLSLLLQKCIPFLCEFLQLHCIVKKKEGGDSVVWFIGHYCFIYTNNVTR